MTLTELKRICSEKAERYPELKDNIEALVDFCEENIERGCPANKEVFTCYEFVIDIIKNHEKWEA